MHRLRCFGRTAIEGPDGTEIQLRSQKHLGLLVYLAAGRGSRFSRERLASLFWGTEPKLARHSLSQALYDITQSVPSIELHRTVREVGLGDDGLAFDAETLAEAVREERLDEAVELYRGDFAPGLEDAGSDDFERWLDEERHRFRRLAETALLRHMSRCDDQARWGAMCLSATRLIAMNPLSEEAHRAYMRALWLQGDQTAAVAHFESERQRLEKGLPGGISEETLDLVRRIRGSRPAVASAAVHERARPPMVGREEEFGELKRLLAVAQEGNGGLAIVRGEAGMGKTRLLEEFHEFAALEGARVLESRCYSAETDVPFGPVVDGLGGLAADQAGSQEEETRYFQLGHLFPDVFGPAAPQPDTFLGTGAGRRRLHEEVADLVRRASADRPVVWLIDDAHWMDASSMSLVHYLVRRLSDHPVMVVCAKRHGSDGADEETLPPLSELRRRQAHAVVELQPLEVAEIRRLVSFVLERNGDSIKSLAENLFSLSGGTPFFALELLDSIQAGSDGADSDSADENGIGYWKLSDNAKSLIRNRLSGLSADAVRVLEIASVAGKHTTRTLLEKVTGFSKEKLARIARTVYAARVLEDKNGVAAFSHEVIREYVYQAMGYLQRSALHAAVGEVLGRSGTRVEPAALAYHFKEAGDRERAFEYAVRAAGEAVSRHAYKEGETLSTIALESAGSPAQRYLSKRRMAEAHIGIGNFEAAASDLEDIVNAAEFTVGTRVELLLQRAQTFLELARWKEALKEVERAEASFHELGDGNALRLKVEALQIRLKIGMRWPSLPIVENASKSLQELLEGRESGLLGAGIRTIAVCNLAVYRVLYESVDAAWETVDGLQVDNSELGADARIQLSIVKGMINIRRGKWMPALETLGQAYKHALEARDLRYQLVAVNNNAACHLTCGHWHSVKECYEKAQRLVDVLPDRIYLSIQPGINYADSLFYQDQTKKAREVYLGVLDAVERLGGCDNGPSVRASLGLCELRLGNWEEALRLRDLVVESEGARPSDSQTPQNVFKVAWLQGAIRWLSGDSEATSILQKAARVQEPRELSESLHLQWLALLLDPSADYKAIDRNPRARSIVSEHEALDLSWFIYFSRRWSKLTGRNNAGLASGVTLIS